MTMFNFLCCSFVQQLFFVVKFSTICPHGSHSHSLRCSVKIEPNIFILSDTSTAVILPRIYTYLGCWFDGKTLVFDDDASTRRLNNHLLFYMECLRSKGCLRQTFLFVFMDTSCYLDTALYFNYKTSIKLSLFQDQPLVTVYDSRYGI